MANTTNSTRTTILMGKPVELVGPELKVGDKAPDFEVIDNTFQTINLEKTGTGVRILSVVPSLDTPVCDAQTKRFEDEAAKMADLKIFTVSTDLPFAQKRWCGNFAVTHVGMLSDHKSCSFGENYGTLIPGMRIESRAVFVVDGNNTLQYVEYVPEVGKHPNYEAALEAAKRALAGK